MTQARLISLLLLAALVASLLGRAHHGGFGGAGPSFV